MHFSVNGQKINLINVSFEDCRETMGANMMGKYKGVQALILTMNSKALFIPCLAHILNLVVADGTKASVIAVSYFGALQKIYKALRNYRSM